MVWSIPVLYGISSLTLLVTVITFLLFLTAAHLLRRKEIFASRGDLELKRWRIIARPFAMLFIPVRIMAGHSFLLYLLGGLSILFIGMDLYRLFSRKIMSKIFKKIEYQRFSSMTSFLVAIFIVFLLFPSEVSYLCLTFIIFGDMAAKLTGIRFGRIHIIHGKTLEGSLGFFSGCLYIGFIICTIFHIDFSYLFIGAACATVIELFSFHMDDNFTVGIVTGGCLQALHYFHVI
jgi:glycerol-3-phosphate acyltransferase PlsY